MCIYTYTYDYHLVVTVVYKVGDAFVIWFFTLRLLDIV